MKAITALIALDYAEGDGFSLGKRDSEFSRVSQKSEQKMASAGMDYLFKKRTDPEEETKVEDEPNEDPEPEETSQEVAQNDNLGE